jgi:ketosteroid isomerase-like protein
MNDAFDPLVTDRQFFSALMAGNVEDLQQILADDFVMIEVMGGSEVTKSSLLEAMESGQLKFEAVKPAEMRVRTYPTTAMITGRTEISGRFNETPFATRSRYTHVYVEQQGRWRLVAAQGTQIAGE